MHNAVQEAKAEKALQVFLQDQQFVTALCVNYNSMKQGTGQRKIVPDGKGAWAADIRSLRTDAFHHPLALYIPAITLEQFNMIKYAKRSAEAEAVVQQMRELVLVSWKRVAWIAGGISNPFMHCPR